MSTLIELSNIANWPPYLVALLCGFTCGIVGPFFVWRNLSFLADAIAHSSLTPLALAAAMSISPLIFLLPFNLSFALLLSYLSLHRPLNLDSYISVLFAGFLGVGLLISHWAGLNGEELLEVLFGNILETSITNTWLTLGTSLAVIGHLYFWRKELQLILIHRDLAATEGVSVPWHEFCLMILLSIVVAVGIHLMGTVLLTSLLVAPTVIARVFAKDLKSLFFISALLGSLFATTGVFFAQNYKVPASGAVAAFCLLTFLLSSLFKPRIS